MKKNFNRIVLAVLLIVGCTAAADAQIIVKVRPAAPVYVRPVAPAPNYVWIDGGWVVRSGHYVYVNGYWTRPRRGYHYSTGHWDHCRGGYAYVPGRWSRGRY